MCHPGRHVRQWQQCQAVQHPDEVFGDVVRVIQGGQSEVLHSSPRILAQVKKAPLYVHLLAKHGRHSLHGHHLEVRDDGGWVGVEAERRARVSDGLQHLHVDRLTLARQQGVDARDARRAERSTNDVQLVEHGWRQRKVSVHEPRVRTTQHAQTLVRREHDDAVADVLPAVVPEERLRVVAASRRSIYGEYTRFEISFIESS